jgi:hypothetical protein
MPIFKRIAPSKRKFILTFTPVMLVFFTFMIIGQRTIIDTHHNTGNITKKVQLYQRFRKISPFIRPNNALYIQNYYSFDKQTNSKSHRIPPVKLSGS